MSRAKVFKNIDEQIGILESKGLKIPEKEFAKIVLLKENYFFLSGYRHIFMKQNKDSKFITGTTFNELYTMFLFDRKIRNIFFKNILVIENNIKSLISYQLSKKYGFKERDYLNPDNFTKDPMRERQVSDIIEKMKRQIRVNGQKHSATIHYLSNYGYIPLWILVKVLSFGITSELYTILKSEDQDEIASFYKLDSSTLSIFLTVLANYRNLCAHEDILFDHRTQKTIPDNKYHYLLKLPQIEDEYIYGKNDLFAVVMIFKHMLSRREFNSFMDEINHELDELKTNIKVLSADVLLNKIGFPDNWLLLKEL